MKPIISGIQQVGIGIPNVHDAFRWYRRHFGIDVKIFEEAAEANLMLPYTGGQPHQRHAILAVNLKGGGGFEIWQYTSRTPELPKFDIRAGDLGLFVARIKADDVKAAFNFLQGTGVNTMNGLLKSPEGKDHFFVKDPFGNIFDIVQGDDWFSDYSFHTGGAAGCMIGVSDMEKAISFYHEILGYDKVVYDAEGRFDDFSALPGGSNTFRRVLVTHSAERQGSFCKLLGKSALELIQVKDRTPNKIFRERYWGDRGFIHLCFDIHGMAEMKALCKAKGHPFTVDSANSFDMGEAAGHFSYIEDPDGTLIEFVETHKIPILKKIGWYLDLRKRDPEKALPNWIVKALRFGRVKD